MSEVWLHRTNGLLMLALVLYCIWEIYSPPAAVGVGLAVLVGYSYGTYERDHYPTPPSEPPPAAQV